MAVDPLSHSTRLNKRNLLAVAAISILQSSGVLHIEKVSFWGEGNLKVEALRILFTLLIAYLGISLGFRLFDDLQNPNPPPTGPSGLVEKSPRQVRLTAAKEAPSSISYSFLETYLQSNFAPTQRMDNADSRYIWAVADAAKQLVNAKFLSKNLRRALFKRIEELFKYEVRDDFRTRGALNLVNRRLILFLAARAVPIFLRQILWSNSLYRTVSRAGQLFEYGLPYAVGALALYALSNPSVAQEWTKSILG